jgi:PIN domain nuclease of toxin-antitoxin system
MRILLDTHIFLWFISGDTQLSTDVRDAIRDPDNEVYLSAVSVWEAIVKYQLGKLPLPEHPETYLPKQRNYIKLPVLPLMKLVWFNWLNCHYYIVIHLTECLSAKHYKMV